MAPVANNQALVNPLRNLEFEALFSNLEAIREKNVEDNLWFVLDAEGDLVLQPRPVPPTNILSRIWECLVRAFECLVCWVTGELPPLEREFIWMSDQVEAYLDELYAARNEQVLGNFLNTYTTAINELYRAAAKMEQAEIFSRETLAHLNGKARIRDYMITEINPHRLARAGAREYHPYVRPVEFLVENWLPFSTVRFRMPGHRMHQQVGERDFQPDTYRSGSFSADDQPLNLLVDVTSKCSVDAKEGSCDIYFGGRKFHKKLKEKESPPKFTIHNESNQNMRIALTGCNPPGGKLVAPHQELTFPLHEKLQGKEVEMTAIYTLEQNITFGCKLARYWATVNKLGGLDTGIWPLHLTAALPREERVVDAQHPCAVVNDSEYLRLMKYRIQRVDGTFFEGHFLIPKGKTIARDYRSLCAEAGVDPDARPNLRVQIDLHNVERILEPLPPAAPAKAVV